MIGGELVHDVGSSTDECVEGQKDSGDLFATSS